MNEAIQDQPFDSFCFSNVDFHVEQWCVWIWRKIEEIVPKVTNHRSNLSPWVLNDTSHMKNVLETIKRNKKHFNISKQLEIKLMDALKLSSRRFSDIQEYLALTRKKPTIPQIVLDIKSLAITMN